jgi:hypothetical protein
MEDDGDGRMSETSSIRGGRSSRGRDVMEESEDLSSQMQSMSVRPQLRCNACWEILLSNDQSAQTCYRTTCSHIFCVSIFEFIIQFHNTSRMVLMKIHLV